MKSSFDSVLNEISETDSDSVFLIEYIQHSNPFLNVDIGHTWDNMDMLWDFSIVFEQVP